MVRDLSSRTLCRVATTTSNVKFLSGNASKEPLSRTVTWCHHLDGGDEDPHPHRDEESLGCRTVATAGELLRAMLSALWARQNQTWTENWLRMLRQLSAMLTEE